MCARFVVELVPVTHVQVTLRRRYVVRAQKRDSELTTDTHMETRTERGTAVIEFALALILLVPVLGGVIDYSMVAQAKRSLSDATRSAARSGVQACIGSGSCTAPNPADADATLYEAIRNVLGSKASGVTKLIIFKSASADMVVPAACLTTTAGGITGQCNVVYDPYSGSTPSIPAFWTIATRNRSNANADYLGVYVEYTHRNLFRLTSATTQLTSQAAFRLEPPVTQSANLQPLPTFPQAPPDAPGWTWTEPDWDAPSGGAYVPPAPGNGAG